MSERPFMQLYVSDYLGDTQHLSCEQHGAYLLLLMSMWNAGGSLPNDDQKIARIVRLSVKKWRALAPDILCFFDVNGRTVSHNRMTKELRKVQSKSEKRAAAGAKGGAAKALKAKGEPLANASDLPGGLPQHLPETRDQKKKDPPTEGPKKAVKGTRLSDRWQPKPNACPELALPTETIARELLKFRDHWKAQSGQRGVKLDWDATWRNWLRRAAELSPTRAPSNLPAGVRKNGTGFYVSHDSPEFPRIMAEAEQRKDNDLYWACKRAEREKGEIKVPEIWRRKR